MASEAIVYVPDRFKSFGTAFVAVPYENNDQVGDVKEAAVDLIRKFVTSEKLEYSSFFLGVWASNRLQKLLADSLILSQISTYSAFGPSTLMLVYVKDLDKAKGKDPTWTFMSDEEKTKVREANAARFKLANELCESEKLYVHYLSIIVEHFYIPLKKSSLPIVSSQELEILFGSIEQIYAIHSQFLDNLTERIKQWSPERHQPFHVFNMIGDLFLTLIPRLEVYATSTSSYVEALKILSPSSPSFSSTSSSSFSSSASPTSHQLNSNTKLQEFVRNAQATPRAEEMQLSALLSFPVQRVPRYVMLLQEFISITPAFHQDYANLHFAAQIMNDTAERIRDASDKRAQEFELQKVAAELDNKHLIREGRKLTRRHKLLLKRVANDSEKQFHGEELYSLFLFDDLLIIAKKKTMSNKLKQIVNVLLSNVSVHTANEGFVLEISPNFLFSASALGSGESGDEGKDKAIQDIKCLILVFVCSSQEAEKWIQDVTRNKRRFLRKPPSALSSTQDVLSLPPQNPVCARCNINFDSTNRRLRCYTCSSAVCDACSRGRAKLNSSDVYKVRVCSWCSGAGNLRFKLIDLQLLPEHHSQEPNSLTSKALDVERGSVFESLGVQFWQLQLENALKTKEDLKAQIGSMVVERDTTALHVRLAECREKIDELVERLIAEKEYADQSINEVVRNEDGKLTLSPTTKPAGFCGSPLAVESVKSNVRAEALLAGVSNGLPRPASPILWDAAPKST